MKKILVVVDMQKDFIDGPLGTTEAVAIVPLVIEKIKTYQAKGDTVYFTKDTHTASYLDTQEGKNLPILHCVKGTEGWELEETIQGLATDIGKEKEVEIVFEKGVFGSEVLAGMIREQIGGEEAMIEVVGLCTDICVLSNAILFKTYMPEVVVNVDAKCCAGVTAETHRNALEAMKMCQIRIV